MSTSLIAWHLFGKTRVRVTTRDLEFDWNVLMMETACPRSTQSQAPGRPCPFERYLFTCLQSPREMLLTMVSQKLMSGGNYMYLESHFKFIVVLVICWRFYTQLRSHTLRNHPVVYKNANRLRVVCPIKIRTELTGNSDRPAKCPNARPAAFVLFSIDGEVID